MVEQAELEFLETHSSVSILIQFVEQVFQLLRKGQRTSAWRPRPPAAACSPRPPAPRPPSCLPRWGSLLVLLQLRLPVLPDPPGLWFIKPTRWANFQPAVSGHHLNFLNSKYPCVYCARNLLDGRKTMHTRSTARVQGAAWKAQLRGLWQRGATPPPQGPPGGQEQMAAGVAARRRGHCAWARWQNWATQAGGGVPQAERP